MNFRKFSRLVISRFSNSLLPPSSVARWPFHYYANEILLRTIEIKTGFSQLFEPRNGIFSKLLIVSILRGKTCHLKFEKIYFVSRYFCISCIYLIYSLRSLLFFVISVKYILVFVYTASLLRLSKSALSRYRRDSHRLQRELVLPKLVSWFVNDRLFHVRFVICCLFRLKWHPAHYCDNARM